MQTSRIFLTTSLHIIFDLPLHYFNILHFIIHYSFYPIILFLLRLWYVVVNRLWWRRRGRVPSCQLMSTFRPLNEDKTDFIGERVLIILCDATCISVSVGGISCARALLASAWMPGLSALQQKKTARHEPTVWQITVNNSHSVSRSGGQTIKLRALKHVRTSPVTKTAILTCQCVYAPTAVSRVTRCILRNTACQYTDVGLYICL